MSLGFNNIMSVAGGILGGAQSPGTVTYTNSRCIARFLPFQTRDLSATIPTLEDVQTPDESLTVEKKLILTPVDTTATDELIEDNAIISCTIARDKNTAAGMFELTLKPIKNYVNLIKPGDWVLIYLDDSSNINLSTHGGLRCIGSVDRIAENKITMESGIVTTTYSISGSDFGKIFDKTEMFYDPYLPQSMQDIAVIEAQIDIQGSPIDFLNGYLDIFLGDATKQKMDAVLLQMLIPPRLHSILEATDRSKGSDVSFNDILVRDFHSNAAEGFSLARTIAKVMSGSLWNTLEQTCNRELNELYVDLVNNRPTIICQKKPLTHEILSQRISDTALNPSNWISESIIVNSNIGSDDHSLFNYVTLFPTDETNSRDFTYALSGEFPKDFPQIDKESIKRFGLQRSDLSTEYGWTTTTLDTNLVLKWMRELGPYWINFNRFENGTLEVIGKNDFHIGQFYMIPERNKAYMVESVQWTWNYQEPIIVSLSLTHGVYTDGSFTDSNRSDIVTSGTSVYQNSPNSSSVNIGLGGLINGLT